LLRKLFSTCVGRCSRMRRQWVPLTVLGQSKTGGQSGVREVPPGPPQCIGRSNEAGV
jgi:hypothetical protein